jgi:hypothetical protein
MVKLVAQALKQGWANRILNEKQLDRLLSGSAASRYGLVNRALAAGELHSVRRGLYVLDAQYRDHAVHPFALAQAILPGSYISFETALAYHGWIPEAVKVIVSVTLAPKAKHYHSLKFGDFHYAPLAVHTTEFLQWVERHQVDQQTFLLAHPLRALLDLVCERKMVWQGISGLTENLRIDESHFAGITANDFHLLRGIYKYKRMQHFIRQFAKAYGYDQINSTTA